MIEVKIWMYNCVWLILQSELLDVDVVILLKYVDFLKSFSLNRRFGVAPLIFRYDQLDFGGVFLIFVPCLSRSKCYEVGCEKVS